MLTIFHTYTGKFFHKYYIVLLKNILKVFIHETQNYGENSTHNVFLYSFLQKKFLYSLPYGKKGNANFFRQHGSVTKVASGFFEKYFAFCLSYEIRFWSYHLGQKKKFLGAMMNSWWLHLHAVILQHVLFTIYFPSVTELCTEFFPNLKQQLLFECVFGNYCNKGNTTAIQRQKWYKTFIVTVLKLSITHFLKCLIYISIAQTFVIGFKNRYTSSFLNQLEYLYIYWMGNFPEPFV